MIIDIKNLKKDYINGELKVSALKNINFQVKKGEFVSIMGPSGSGKSTLMNILGCLDKPTSGYYILDKLEVEKANDNELSEIRNQKIGFVFQAFNLLNRLNSFENVELPLIYNKVHKAKRKKLALEALERVGLVDRVKHKPTELSGGQKQRVAIARALVSSPAMILADEPTGNLDSHSGEEIMKIFKKLNAEGVTIVMVTHEPDIAEHTKRIITVKDGEIISDINNVR
ncbi:ABC transporter ATP-binding protein [Haliovirga abyssi]|uniref:Macrolide ABC transporter ATP-binding protein n=1 Tax=Haliovirga abyssi TaxID=2996794 RepID=A0AAU9DZ89_9FUSO|nr:ABC transporter ATP-binding protein [Haliovirga abyssi]BDU50825.1 macrolide ABC transporter ATP-binding protein [Haliovirga abyssi]